MPSLTFLNDLRISHFYDTNKTIGKTIAESVGWAGNIAWDIYLFYAPGAEWIDAPPRPDYWMHQLSDAWAKNEHYRTGTDLQNELFASLQNLL
jgi:hypothetical protein